MAQILETVDLDVPVTIAYNQWTQFESFPEFLSVVDEVTQVTGPRLPAHADGKIQGETDDEAS